MEPTRISIKKLQEIIDELVKGSEDSRGTFLYKDFRLQISKYKASGAERTSRLYQKRRQTGMCIRCGAKITQKNPRTGKLYRLCEYHRTMIDMKENGKRKKSSGLKKSTSMKPKTGSSGAAAVRKKNASRAVAKAR